MRKNRSKAQPGPGAAPWQQESIKRSPQDGTASSRDQAKCLRPARKCSGSAETAAQATEENRRQHEHARDAVAHQFGNCLHVAVPGAKLRPSLRTNLLILSQALPLASLVFNSHTLMTCSFCWIAPPATIPITEICHRVGVYSIVDSGSQEISTFQCNV